MRDDVAAAHRLRRWQITAGGLGLALGTYGALNLLPGASPGPATEGLRQSVAVGLALLAAAVVFPRWLRSDAGVAVADRDARPLEARRSGYPTLFLASFSVLFIEILLIRYVGSQIRIFAFFKNIPLIASFLGLGLGLWLGRPGSNRSRWFLLWLLPLVGFLAGGATFVDGVLSQSMPVASSEIVLGDIAVEAVGRPLQLLGQVVVGAFCAGLLVAIMLLFAHLGRVLADAFEGIPRLPGYTVNILGSLAGILAFTGLSFLQTPPWVWFLCGLAPLLWWAHGRRDALRLGALIGLAALIVWPSVGETRWSPYQKLVGRPTTLRGPRGEAAEGYVVQVSDVFYQVALDLRPEAIERYGYVPYPHYDASFAGLSRLDRVLIVGTGTGNDVAAALRAGADRVDAVEIDPAIVEMGREHHPEDPYGDPRVRVIVEDARRAFRTVEPASYDAVVFGLLDSHTQLGMSSVRLDNFVFTAESFEAAVALLRPGGSLIVTSAVFRPWFGERLRALVHAACGADVDQQTFHVWVSYRCTVGDARTAADVAAAVRASSVAVPTDDWPFLYLERRGVPGAYVFVVLLLALVSVAVLKRGGLPVGEFSPYHVHMFFLGAAFLLMEVYAINRLALLFGTTWIVSAVTIATVLSLIVLANLTVTAFRRIPYGLAYVALAGAAAASFSIDPGAVLGATTVTRYGYALLVLSPVYFAGLVFARSFATAKVAGAALGANILGSALGGWVEYSTMALGIRAMVPLAVVMYAASLGALARHRRSGSGSAPPT